MPELHRAAAAARVRDLAHPTAKMSKSAAGGGAGGDPDARLPGPGAPRGAAGGDRLGHARCGTTPRPGPASPTCWRSSAPAPAPTRGRWPATTVVRRPEAGRRGRRRRGAGPVQARYAELAGDPAEVDRVLDEGRRRAEAAARPRLEAARRRGPDGLTPGRAAAGVSPRRWSGSPTASTGPRSCGCPPPAAERIRASRVLQRRRGWRRGP